MSAPRALGWGACALLLLTCFLRPRESPRPGSFPARVLGPIASLAASWQWVRVRLALQDDRPEVAYSRAELAFELDPGATSAWSYLASHLAHDRASAERERNPARSASWVRAALDLLERGERAAREPAELAVHRGLILAQIGDLGPAVRWPGGPTGAWREAQEAFERALELDPESSAAWVLAATNASWTLGSPEVEPELAGRLRALDAALEILDRGQVRAREPERLGDQRGLLLGLFAEGPDGEARPGGRRALYLEAIRALEAAETLGHREAHAAAEGARRALEKLE